MTLRITLYYCISLLRLPWKNATDWVTNSRNLFLTLLEARIPRSGCWLIQFLMATLSLPGRQFWGQEVWDRDVSRFGFFWGLSGWRIATFSLSSHGCLSVCMHVLCLFLNGHKFLHVGPTLMTSPKPNYLLKAHLTASSRAFQVVPGINSLPANAGRDAGLVPLLGRSPGGGHGNPFQYFSWGIPKDRGAWWATVHRVTKSWTRLKWLSMHAHMHHDIGCRASTYEFVAGGHISVHHTCE